MGKVRSPNYPTLSLGPALDAIRPAYTKDHRNKMSRAVLAAHMGYTSLNGRALGKIGAVRAYGLIEGSGDELKISDDAVTALMAPANSNERVVALGRLASKPALFQELRKDFPDTLPSIENLKFALIKRQFTPDAAEKAAKSYLATMNLVAGWPDAYNPPDEESSEGDGGIEEEEEDDPPPPPKQKVKIMAGERELTTGLLAKDASFRLIVSGNIGVKEIERLIKKLEIDKEILAEQDQDEGEKKDIFE
ncbi:hypothetical protein ABIF64_000441 [Bradyrhizobium japonicum]|uniref:hypothetical protein n=1 Tax=Bradyrhizobium japonicum TaxID=375 RepID=UPI003390DE20